MGHFPHPAQVFALLFISQILYGIGIGGTIEINSSNGSCIESELKALIQFRKNLVDKSNRLSSWIGKDCCAWSGVGCSKNTGHVVSLDLDLHNPDEEDFSHYLGGQLNPSLINLKHLRYLDLSWNNFNSNIPLWLCNLTSLVSLRLSNSHFHGPIPDSFGKLASLTILDLSLNSFDATMPKWLCNLTSLVYLDLSHCGFQGSIPSEIGRLEKLSQLRLSHNELKGSIPPSMGKLAKLQVLDISYNSLTGVLSEQHFKELTELKSLRIDRNSVTLNFNSSWIPPFQLQHIYLDSIKVGPQFPAWLKTQREVKELEMFNASLSGAIPNWFRIISSDFEFLDLSNNNLTGKPPLEFTQANNTYKRIIYLKSNKFEGSIKSFSTDILTLDLSRNFLTGNIPLPNGDATDISIKMLQLSYNRFTGSIPNDLCKIQTLVALDISNNQLSGRIPLCLGNLGDLWNLNLANNSLSGHIPSSLGNLEFLQNLQLSGNRFVGNLPSSFQNLMRLEFLDLGENRLQDTIPAWIGEKLSSLKILRFQSNNFHGNISYTLCQLSPLIVLNLAKNNFTGKIPQCFKNLSMMLTEESGFLTASISVSAITLSNFMKGRELQYYLKDKIFLKSISLSENNLVGEIPEEITDLVGLRNLDLSNNHLSGRIPKTIGNLKLLESLDLSVNELSGAIPPSLSAIISLAYLNLSHNKLSGRIPSGNQLQTLNDPSIYEGNDGLCGKPLQDCPEDKSPSGNGILPDHHSRKERHFPWFYSGIGPGFAVGFLGVLSILHFNKSWRYAYFKMVENGCDRIWMMIILCTSRLQRKFH